jgi:hypothetical protein
VPFVFHRGPFICIGGVRLEARNTGPGTGEIGVNGYEVFLAIGYVFFGVYRVYWALGNTDGTVDALVRVYDQKIGALTEAVDRADVDAVCVTTLDAGFCNNMGHGNTSSEGGNKENWSIMPIIQKV